MKNKLRPLSRARVPNPEQFERELAIEIRGLLAQLGGDGWGFLDIAESIGCSRTTLYSWRIGAADMPASKLLALRALVAQSVDAAKLKIVK